MSLLQSFGLGGGYCPYHGYSCSGMCIHNMGAQQQQQNAFPFSDAYRNALYQQLAAKNPQNDTKEKEETPDINRKLLLLIR